MSKKKKDSPKKPRKASTRKTSGKSTKNTNKKEPKKRKQSKKQQPNKAVKLGKSPKKGNKKGLTKKKDRVKLEVVGIDELDVSEVVTPEDVHSQYEFKNFFESEPQLDAITEHSAVEDILAAYQRIIFVYAKNHLPPESRPGSLELQDLIAQGQLGICIAVDQFRNPDREKPKYDFKMACIYKLKDCIYKYTIGNANQLETPVYIQRGLMHVAQIFELLQTQKVAEEVLKRPGPASKEEIVEFLYNEDERLPLKSKAFIKQQINRKVSSKEFKQIYIGVTTHKRGSQHSYVKNNLTDLGKILHIKEKIWYTFKSNNMKYQRGIELILSAQRSQAPLEDAIHSPVKAESVESKVSQRELFEKGAALCGEKEFNIVIDNTCMGLSYDELAEKYNLKKAAVTEVVKKALRTLRGDEVFIQYYKDLK